MLKKIVLVSGSNSASEEENPPVPKKSVPAESGSTTSQADEEGPTFHIRFKRTLTIQKVQGKDLIDIREFYEKDGELRPGKEGISPSPFRWTRLNDLMEQDMETLDKKC